MTGSTLASQKSASSTEINSGESIGGYHPWEARRKVSRNKLHYDLEKSVVNSRSAPAGGLLSKSPCWGRFFDWLLSCHRRFFYSRGSIYLQHLCFSTVAPQAVRNKANKTNVTINFIFITHPPMLCSHQTSPSNYYLELTLSVKRYRRMRSAYTRALQHIHPTANSNAIENFKRCHLVRTLPLANIK